MSRRKLVRSGSTSYTLSIPIDWVRKNGLQAGDEVVVTESPRGGLRVETGDSPHTTEKTVLDLDVDELNDEEIETRLLLAYIHDVDAINIKGSQLGRRIPALTAISQNLIGFDIMDQSADYLKIKDFFHLDDETRPQAIIHKMTVINRAAFDAIIAAFKEGAGKELLYDIEQYRDQNKKLSSVAQKSMFTLLDDPQRMREFQLDALQIVKLTMHTQAYRRIATRLAHLAQALTFIDYGTDETKAIQRLFRRTRNDHDELLVLIAHSDREGLMRFLVDSRQHERRFRDAIVRTEDMFHARVVDYMQIIYSNLQEAAFTALL